MHTTLLYKLCKLEKTGLLNCPLQCIDTCSHVHVHPKTKLYCNIKSQYCTFEVLVAMVTVIILMFVYSYVINMVSFANETSKEVFKPSSENYVHVLVCQCTYKSMYIVHTCCYGNHTHLNVYACSVT